MSLFWTVGDGIILVLKHGKPTNNTNLALLRGGTFLVSVLQQPRGGAVIFEMKGAIQCLKQHYS